MMESGCGPVIAALDQLARLRARGFVFTPMFDQAGRPDRLLGVYQREGYIDAVVIYSEHEAVAWRTCDQGGALRPGSVVWSGSGSVVQVVAELLALPAPEERLAPRLERRAPLDLWLPGRGRG